MGTRLIKTINFTLLGVIAPAINVYAQKAPNVVIVLADEWRAQDLGFMGNMDVLTPNLDRIASQGINFTNTVSCCPVSCPYRGSLLTGQYPLTTGVFVNDVLLNPEVPSMAKIFKAAGYQTAYIGKWHLDGHGRSSFIPRDRRQGFDYWKVLECTHDYNNSLYWGNDDKLARWPGYDAFAQTLDAADYIKKSKQDGNPFLMILSWGPPHAPFGTAPENLKQMYRSKKLRIRSNVPPELKEQAVKEMIGYYGHISALDSCLGILQSAIRDAGIEQNTVFVFTSDHGAMIKSHGFDNKQQPYEESVHVPLVIRYPERLGNKGRNSEILINTPDMMPTLLGLCSLQVPESVEGENKTPVILGVEKDTTKAVLIACYHPFGQWNRSLGGKEYRGVRTEQYTYVRDIKGPWLLFDNQKDKFQMNNLVGLADYSEVQKELDKELKLLLKRTKDEFLPGMEYIKKWGYVVDESETIPYDKINYQGLPIK